MNRIDLEGRNAVVTGGARGIGLAVAERFAASGARVALWDLDASTLARARQSNASFRTYAVDVTSEAAVREGVQSTVRDMGRIDILVNGAGIAGARVKVIDCDYADWQRVVDVNLNGTFLCCREVLKHMQVTGYGRIVNVASIAGKEGNAYSAHYSAAKAGVISLTKSLAKEAIGGDIRINAVAPAAVQTDLFAAMPMERQQAAVGRIPMGRAGRVEEVAAMIAWIASEECSFTTGFAFDLSGGRATY